LNPAQNEAAIGLYVLRIRRREGWMVEAEFEDRCDLTLRLAFAHERAVAARAKRQGECVEQNRFAGAGLAGKNGEAAAKRKIELIDQDNVADGEVNQHPADVPLAPASLICRRAARRLKTLAPVEANLKIDSRADIAVKDEDNVVRVGETAKRKKHDDSK
jgi:hypothetical protein